MWGKICQTLENFTLGCMQVVAHLASLEAGSISYTSTVQVLNAQKMYVCSI
jgi:hypothetical protein